MALFRTAAITPCSRQWRRLLDACFVALTGVLLWVGATMAQAPPNSVDPGAALQAPIEIRYGADGISAGTLRAAMSSPSPPK